MLGSGFRRLSKGVILDAPAIGALKKRRSRAIADLTAGPTSLRQDQESTNKYGHGVEGLQSALATPIEQTTRLVRFSWALGI